MLLQLLRERMVTILHRTTQSYNPEYIPSLLIALHSPELWHRYVPIMPRVREEVMVPNTVRSLTFTLLRHSPPGPPQDARKLPLGEGGRYNRALVFQAPHVQFFAPTLFLANHRFQNFPTKIKIGTGSRK
jgi:hypothetical protein